MPKKANNQNLNDARDNKKDEFYTQLGDIEREMRHYKSHFRKKVVYCNCDDPRVSNFFHYFSYNFEKLGLKQLITTCYKNQDMDLFSENNSEKAIYLVYDGDKNGNKLPDIEEIGVNNLTGDGDFRSKECIELLKKADIVVTNPPFSLFREYVAQLIEYDKKFIIIGSLNAVAYKEIFKLIKENKLWSGYGFLKGNAYFKTSHNRNYAEGVFDNNTGLVKFRNVNWYTNLDILKRHEDLILYKTHKGNENNYPPYDNYDAIEVGKIDDIPIDFKGVMGVPITFIDKHNPDQFEIIGSNRGVDQDPNGVYGKSSFLNGKETFKRLFIKNKRL